jgi:hypothetical protein
MILFKKDKLGDFRTLNVFGLRIPYRRFKSVKTRIKEMRWDLELVANIHLTALSMHKASFGEYKGFYKNKDVVLVGTAPSAKDYKPIFGAIHIGVNRAFRMNHIPLHMLFMQDRMDVPGIPELAYEQEDADAYEGENCLKFYGMHYSAPPIPESSVEKAGAKRYVFIDRRVPESSLIQYSTDITTRPLNVWGSCIFSALEMALWTHPKRIYLVGCDCATTGNFDGINEPKENRIFEPIYYGWKMYRDYIASHYPDIDVVSVNPVRLKGMFRDIEM